MVLYTLLVLILSVLISSVFAYFTRNTVYKFKIEGFLNGWDDNKNTSNNKSIISKWGVDQYFSSSVMSSKLKKAGLYNEIMHNLYLPGKFGLWVFSIIVFIYTINGLNNMFIASIISLVICIIFPDVYISLREKKVTKSIARDLPYLIDMTAMNVKSGMTIDAALVYLEDDIARFNRHMAFRLAEINASTRAIGLPRALANFSDSVDNRYVRSFTFTLTQSIKFGSSIYDILIELADNIRTNATLDTEEKIGKLAAKISIPLILLIMMPIVILIIAPGLMRLMYGVK